jgi:hypothetical protein
MARFYFNHGWTRMDTDLFTQRRKGAIFRCDLHELTRIENALKALRSTAQGWRNPLDGCEHPPQARKRRREKGEADHLRRGTVRCGEHAELAEEDACCEAAGEVTRLHQFLIYDSRFTIFQNEPPYVGCYKSKSVTLSGAAFCRPIMVTRCDRMRHHRWRSYLCLSW